MKRTLFGCCVALAGVAGLGALARCGTKKKTAAAAQPEEIKAPAGRPQTINWAMNYGGARLVVPTLWHQAGRVVFDLLILPDQPKAQAFYHQVRDLDEDALPARELAALLRRRPLGSVNISALTIDGRRACLSSEGRNFCGFPDEPDAAAWRKLYPRQLLLARHFGVVRCTARCDGSFAPVTRSMTMRLGPECENLPMNKSWNLPLDGRTPPSLTFADPATGCRHTLYLQPGHTDKIAGEPTLWAPGFWGEVVPPLPQGSRLNFDASLSQAEAELWMQQREEKAARESAEHDEIAESAGKFRPTAQNAAMIGVIGGADGPTAVFVTRKGETKQGLGPHGQPWQWCPARLRVQTPLQAKLVLQGMQVQTHPCRTYAWNWEENR